MVRAGARRPMGPGDDGLTEELLSPDLTDDFEMIHSTFHPGTRLDTPTQRRRRSCLSVTGRLDLEIGPRAFTIRPGDTFRIRGEPFRWANPYAEPAVAIWVIAPPVY